MENQTFESALKRLEEIVAALEREDCPLSDSIKLYDEGLKLSKLCSEQLKSAQQKIINIEDYIKENADNE